MKPLTTLTVDIADGVATVCMNRPAVRNAFNPQMRRELLAVINEVEKDETTRVVVLTGRGEGFSAGQDLNEIDPTVATKELLEYEYKPIVNGIRNSNKIYISAINGACAGAAIAIVLACDLGVMAEDAGFYPAFAVLGLIPDAGINWMMLRRVGYKRALELSIDGGKISAERALGLGLVNRLTHADELMNEVQAWALDIARGSGQAQAYAKQVLQHAQDADFLDSFSFEADKQDILYSGDFVQSKIRSFLEKKATS